jgi:signal transduction histidine kinase/DNA-binding NarL/FixJ family response regulator
MRQSDLESIGWLAGGGEMGARVRAKDWAVTPLGAPETWPQSIKTAVSICLNSKFPIVLWLGPELRLVYNDTYIPFLGDRKHPAMLGATGLEAWGEIWDTIGPLHAEVAAGKAVSVEHLQMFFARRLAREEVYATFGYSPILSDDCRTIEGVFCACTETTEQIIGERRLATLRDLGAHSPQERSAEAACRDAAEVLHGHPLDIPFAAIYLLNAPGTNARRVGGTRLPIGSAAFPDIHPVADGDALSMPWPLRRVVETQQCCEVSDLPRTVGVFPAGPWPDAVETAFALPLTAPTAPWPAGILIAGVSPRRVVDFKYQSFLDLVARHIGTGIAEARAFEAERKRAEALAEIDRVKTTFFSNVSHEFRTPLTLMLNPLEEVLANADNRLPPESRQLLDIAHRNALRLLRLVNTLLDFSRVEAGRMQASYEPVDLPKLTAEIASDFQSACERAGLTLKIDCPPIPELVYVDRDMWEKIVLNLLSNAFKATLQGQIEVTTRSDAQQVVLTVSDTGVGIPELELPRIFERFHRIEGQNGRTHEGSGIGLALVQDLVLLHGGKVAIRSQVGQGTKFTVTVLFGSSHLPPDHISEPPALDLRATGAQAFVEEALRWLPTNGNPTLLSDDLAPGIVPTRLQQAAANRAHVLLAEDNADMRDYISRLLSSQWDVEAVADGRAALDSARRRKPDLVLADIMMPCLDGIGLLSALRNDPPFSDLPIILLSARAGEEAQVEGLAIGADDYLVKPFSARELIARVSSHLALARLRTAELSVMSRLHDLSSRLITTSDLPAVLYEVLEATIELLGADFGNIQLYDLDTGTLRIAAQRGFEPEFLDYFARVDAHDCSACGMALRQKSRVVIEDVELDPAFAPHRHIAASAGFRAVQSTPLVDHHGEPVGMLSTHFRKPRALSDREQRLTDLYARQAAFVIARRLSEQRLQESEAKLRWLNETLEQRVSQRSAEAEEANRNLRSEIEERVRAEERLQALQMELFHAARLSAVGQLATALAHELNQPLGAATNFVNAARRLLASGDPRRIDTVHRNMEEAAAQTLRAGQIIRRLRDFVRQGETDRRAEDLVKMIEEASALAFVGLAASGVQTCYLLDANASMVFADRIQIQQVLVNLMRNGIEAMSESMRRELVMTTTRREQEMVEISVADSGPGIAPEVIDRLFQPFNSTKRDGMGLGLSICRTIVEAHGGRIWAEPNPTGGTIFCFSLAVAPNEDESNAR